MAAGCNSKPSGAGSNVLLITIDTLRSDHLGCYQYNRNTSPNIDKFSEAGALFKNAYCQMPTTGPSHASIFTSTYPRRHGVLKNGWALAPAPSYQTLAEILKKNGYKTGAVVSSFALDPSFGFSRGFDEYDAKFSAEGSSMGHDTDWEGLHFSGGFDQRANVATEKAMHWIQMHEKEKFFLWMHYFDPHSPYVPPEPYAREFLKDSTTPLDKIIAHYDGEILFVDEQVGKLLDYIKEAGLDSKTLIIIMSDHGEGLGQHNWMEHGMYLYDEQTRIPLLMNLPGIIPEKTSLNSIVETIDIAPTVLDILDIKKETHFMGKSLYSMILKPEDSSDHIVFIERRRYETTNDLGVEVLGQKFAVRNGNLKYIWAPQEGTEELYNILKDPGELLNVADGHPDVTERMQNMIKRWEKEQESGQQKVIQTVDPETRKKLKSLGYVD